MIKSVPDAEKYSKAGFEACMKKALFAGQAADRKAAKDKGKTSHDTHESVGGGNEAKERSGRPSRKSSSQCRVMWRCRWSSATLWCPSTRPPPCQPWRVCIAGMLSAFF